MSIVVNSTPLISLSILNQLDLLLKIFDDVIVPSAVYSEVIMNGKGKSGYNNLSKVDWFNVIEIENIGQKQSIMIELDEGEAEVITIAKEKSIKLICVDEFAGRRYAKLLGLEVIGTLGVLLIAKQEGYISELKPLFQKLLDSNRHIGKTLCNQILIKAGESLV